MGLGGIPFVHLVVGHGGCYICIFTLSTFDRKTCIPSTFMYNQPYPAYYGWITCLPTSYTPGVVV